MKKLPQKWLIGIGACAALLAGAVFLTCSPTAVRRKAASGGQSADTEMRILTIGTADSGGTMYPAGSALAQVLSEKATWLKMNTSASNGSIANVEGLRLGQIDLGLVSGDVAFCAYYGMEEFSGKPESDLRVIAALYPSLSNWIVREESGLTYVHELEGKRIALGPEGSTTEISARAALAAIGLNGQNSVLFNTGLGSGSKDVETGAVDALHGFAGIPIKGMQELAEKTPCRLLRYTSEELRLILDDHPAYNKAVIPAGTYLGQTEDVDTFGVNCLLCVDADMDEELVYAITKILAQSVPELTQECSILSSMETPGYLCNKMTIPLHPGAERYYIEQGLLEKRG